MALLIAVELFTLLFAIHTLSAVRAYVGGEGLWSKAQKDAIYYLQKYYRTHDEADYKAFQDFMKVPLGDHKARIEMLKEKPDLNIVREGFLEGRIHPNDIDGIIKLFRRFHNISYIHDAIIIWTQADSIVSQLPPLGEKIHEEITSSTGIGDTPASIVLLNQLAPIDQQLTVLEDNFSFTLGEGSRWLENLILKLLFGVALTVEISGLLLTISVSRGIARGINEIVRASKLIAKGDFNIRAKSYTEDEIGTLAASFNQMSDDLKKRKDEQKRAEEDLKGQKEMYETLINAQSEMGIGVTVTEDQKIVYANAALCKMYGYDEEEILSMPSFLSLVVENDRERVTNRMKQRLAGDNLSDTGETAIVRKDGTVLNIEYSLKQVAVGNKKQLVSVIRDVTERKRAEEELLRSNKELEQFAYVASHDLQEPLRTISSYVQLLQSRYQDKLDQDANEFIHFAVDASERMRNLINDLLTYSRVTTQPKILSDVDCNQIVKHIVDSFASRENNKTKFIISDLPVIKADQLQMAQLFQNLISNAVKFNKDKTPQVLISARQQNHHYLFSVKDNGIGISPDYKEKIFVIFQRLHNRIKYPGTGIGLAICKKIVELYGGKIWVESKEGEGSTFYFTIRK